MKLKLTLLGAALTLSGVAGCDGEAEIIPPQYRKVRYIVAEEAGSAKERMFSGVLQAAEESRLSFQVGGRVEKVNIKMGDRVKVGDVIAQLDQTDFRLSLQEARASLARAQAEAKRAEADYQRTSTLYANNGVSVQELDSARASRDSTRSSVRASANSVESLRRQLGYATLTARTAGVVREVAVEVNETVQSGNMIALVQAGEELEVAIDIPEIYVNRISRGNAVKVSVPALGDSEVDGSISEIGVPTVSGAAYPVRVAVDLAKDLKAESGMAASVRITFPGKKGREGVFRVPAGSVGEDREGRYVYVIEMANAGEKSADDAEATGTVKRVSVDVGSLEGGMLEVESGLNGGELIITAGVRRLFDGVTVLVPPTAEAIPL
ncbi:MAG: efflux RND transporter periplasmic adaptor subunit [Myxococcota bacterium]